MLFYLTIANAEPTLDKRTPYAGTRLEDLYRERVEQILAEQLRLADDPEARARLLATARHYSVEPDAGAYREAAGLARARASLAAFRKAIEGSDLEAAQSVLRRAEALVDGHLDRERAVLESLSQAQARERSLPSLDGCQRLADASAQIEAGEFEAAWCKLKEALATEAVPGSAARLKRELAAARNVSEARRLVATDHWKAAMVKLREAIRHEPRNRHALFLLLTLEILSAGITGDILDQAAATGTAAIEAFLAGNHEDCRRLAARTASTLKSSYAMRFIQAAVPGETQGPNASM